MILRGGWAAVGVVWCGELELSDRFGGRAFGNLHHIVLLLLLHPSYFDLRPSFSTFPCMPDFDFLRGGGGWEMLEAWDGEVLH